MFANNLATESVKLSSVFDMNGKVVLQFQAFVLAHPLRNIGSYNRLTPIRVKRLHVCDLDK